MIRIYSPQYDNYYMEKGCKNPPIRYDKKFVSYVIYFRENNITKFKYNNTRFWGGMEEKLKDVMSDIL